ncbi:Inner membrane protein YjgN [compost metagenome]
MTDAAVFPAVSEHPSPASDQPIRFSFSGTGSEYFRIWIVNLLFSLLTLGIYSAWAKVRRARYFYGSTSVAGTSFEYHGNAVAILKGRIAAVILIVVYNIAVEMSPITGLIMFIAAMAITPWLVWKSLQFKLYNSSYRGIRFGFRGTLMEIYWVYLALPIFTLLTFFGLAPFTHQRIKQFQHRESRFGTTHFSFTGTVGSFYKAYLLVVAIWLAGVAAISITFGGTLVSMLTINTKDTEAVMAAIGAIILFGSLLYIWMFLLIPIFATLIQNLIWNNTQLNQHRFLSDMKWTRMAFITITNILGIICTLGLFLPFAQIRAMKYRVECMALLPDGSLETFIAASKQEVAATGEGVADLLDFDLSL